VSAGVLVAGAEGQTLPRCLHRSPRRPWRNRLHGGTGENQATLRERITEDVDFIGLHTDHDKNAPASNSPRPISSAA